MIEVHSRSHERLEFSDDELGMSLDDLGELPWVVAGVARVSKTRLGVELSIGPFVGQLLIPGRLLIQVGEMVPGTLAACLQLSHGRTRSAEQASGGSATIMDPVAGVVALLARDLDEYVVSGIERRYEPVTASRVRPRGQIDVRATLMGPWRAGRRSELVCRYRAMTADTPAHRLLLAAAGRGEMVPGVSAADRSALARAAVALGGATLEVLPDANAARIDAITNQRISLKTIQLAELVLTGTPVASIREPSDSPISTWVNAELVFEDAVRTILAELFGPGAVRSGRGDDVSLFSSKADEPPHLEKRADPDVVIRVGGDAYLLDAKYRRHGESVAEDELYQLMAHSTAYAAKAAALVAPALMAAPAVRPLGRDRNGTWYDLVSVDPSDAESMRKSLRDWAEMTTGVPVTARAQP